MYSRVFPGQQSDEKVLYEVRPHLAALYVTLVKIVGLSLVLFVFLMALARISPIFALLSFVISGAVMLIGAWATVTMFGRSVAYITDRRIVRFEAATPFATNSRALTWDQVAKIKTFPRNIMWKMLKVGTVAVHAASTFVHTHEHPRENIYTNDDLELEHVYYYKDLGNYLDKILYLYKHKPQELEELKPFIPKPAGQRD